MRKQLCALFAVVALASLILLRCGGNNVAPPSQMNVGSGSVAIFGGDAPICDVMSFDVTFSDMSLTPQGGGTAVPVTAPGSPIDFAALMDFFTVLNLSKVQAGTYSQITLTLSSPQITVLDTTKSPPASTQVPTSFSNGQSKVTLTLDIDPPLVVAANDSVALNLDFRLRKSIQTDAQGQVTGVVNPVIRVRAQRASTEKESSRKTLGDDDELKGTVQSVSTTASNDFIGSIMLTTETGKSVAVDVTKDTKFEGVSDLSALKPNTFVEVDAFVDDNLNVVAREVEVEEDEGHELTAFAGVITSVNRDSTSQNVTDFKLFIRHEQPDEGSLCVPRHSDLTVNVSSTTEFKITAEGVNRAGLAFDGSSLGPGQIVVVFGQCQAAPAAPTTTPPSVNAVRIFLRLQAVLGNFSKLLDKESDDKTGGFSLIPCGAVFQGQPITVFTFAETGFADVPGLGGLTPQPMLVLKGLLLYESKQAITVNNITTATPPPAVPVFEAKVVHQLESSESH